jgi:putative membrane protein
MTKSPYTKFESSELILRDELAIDRTILANERTLLAYLRSGVSLVIAGVSIMHFSLQSWFWAIGVVCIPVGIITGIFGVVRYRTINLSITAVRRQLPKLTEIEQRLSE